MNALIALIFSAVVVSALPQPQTVEVQMEAAAAAAASGAAFAGQAVSENVVGDASLVSLNGVTAELDQDIDIVQAATVDLSGSSPATSTVQAVVVDNAAIATDILLVEASASDSINVQNSAATEVLGSGAIAADAATSNNVNGKKN